MGTLDGKVAFITGAARGQGRAHAVRLAEEGADIIGIDICDQIDTVTYPMSTKDDLAETVALVEKLGRRMEGSVVDVRNADALSDAAARGVRELGRLDIVIANAGIMFQGLAPGRDNLAFRDAIDVMLVGVWNTIQATLPALQEQREGGSIVLISSVNGLKGMVAGTNGGNFGYAAAKHGIVGLMRMYANLLAPESIRVNTVHPTGVDTPMLAGFGESMAAANPALAQGLGNPMPVGTIEPRDVSNAIAWLVSDAARYVTGITLPVDAGMVNK
ncbi:mycofactocin-coupled SDR family oxidoreductase [Mycolicibacterium hodleri]|uniref:NAD(P)-dependent oxidoreductase n=1 Tax=Mycolicibacterium hodleri TaxID=49897 RepID=A0A502E7Q4_9MYCO|nr:mycofactocin-coupled SDR family oxidoreductase [Mycolicibacterium hodleri]TPG32470.1 NAD(P)-dependent oxidoreductase [Mycolicibacterium hodleri]